MATDLRNNSQLYEAVAVISEHYPWASEGSPSASSLGIPMWSSEDDSTFYNQEGIGCLARILNVRKWKIE